MRPDERNETMQYLIPNIEQKGMPLVGLHGRQMVSKPTETATAKSPWFHRFLVVWSPTSMSNHG